MTGASDARSGRVRWLAVAACLVLSPTGAARAGDTGAAPAAPAPEVMARFGAHEGFTRLVLDWPGPVHATVGTTDGVVTLSFDRKARLNVARLNDLLPPSMRPARLRSDGAGLTFRVPAGLHPHDHSYGNLVIIDLLRGEVASGPGSPAKPPGADTIGQSAKPVKPAEHETPAAVAAAPPPSPAVPPSAPPRVAPTSTAMADTAAAAPAPQSPPIVVAESLSPGANPPPPALAPAPAAAAPPPASPPPAPAKPAKTPPPKPAPKTADAADRPKPARDAKPKPGRTDTGAAKSRPAVAEAAPSADPAPPRVASAPQPDAGTGKLVQAPVPVEPPPLQTAMVPDAPPPRPVPGEGADDEPVVLAQTADRRLRVTTAPLDEGFSLRFEWSESVKAAVFKLRTAAWVVFDRPERVSFNPQAASGGEAVPAVIQIDNPSATVLRMPVSDDAQVVVGRAGNVWLVDVRKAGPWEKTDSRPATRVLTANQDGLYATRKPGQPVTVVDQDSGEVLLAIPVRTAGIHFADNEDHQTFHVLPTAQGMLFRPESDRMRLVIEDDGARVTSVPDIVMTKDPQ